MTAWAGQFQSSLVEQIPRVLALLDKNPLSPTFGCFDRKYWQYKIIDFPSGMAQELVLPLVYAWQLPDPGNPYYHNERIRHYIDGCVNFHERCTHRDGGMDDYFPGERALGATAYATAALSETLLLLGSPASSVPAAVLTSGSFLARHREAGALANHLAIAALALHNLFRLTQDRQWSDAAQACLARLAALQDAEGWFMEYEGCDLGYQTVTIEFLASTKCWRGPARSWPTSRTRTARWAVNTAAATPTIFIPADSPCWPLISRRRPVSCTRTCADDGRVR